MRPKWLRRRFVTVCAIGGAIVPILDIAVITVLGELQPNYSHVRQFISELGETGRPFAAVANLWFVLVSTMFGGFAIALLKGTPLSRASTIGALFFGAWTATGIIGGFFPCDSGCAGDTLPGAIHVILGEIGAICLLPVPALIWLGVRGDPRWMRYYWFTLAVQGLALASFLLLGAVYFGISPLDRLLEAAIGLIQRFSLGVYYAWTAVIGLKIARTNIERANDVAPNNAGVTLGNR
jgi:hypothetical protein